MYRDTIRNWKNSLTSAFRAFMQNWEDEAKALQMVWDNDPAMDKAWQEGRYGDVIILADQLLKEPNLQDKKTIRRLRERQSLAIVALMATGMQGQEALKILEKLQALDKDVPSHEM